MLGTSGKREESDARKTLQKQKQTNRQRNRQRDRQTDGTVVSYKDGYSPYLARV